MIHFNNDYLEGCHPKILEALQQSNLEQTCGYGLDPYCDKARAILREVCGTPGADVHFLVGGTQTNATAIASILRPYQGVLSASTGHINVHETGAIEHSGHKVLTIPSEDGKISAPQVEQALREHFEDDGPEHLVQPGMLYLTFPTELGTIYSKAELLQLKQVCKDWNLPLYIDGARLGYGLASPKCDLTIKDIAAIADIFYIGGTKQGALFGEALIINDSSLKKDFRYYIKQNGGLLAKGRLLGIQFSTLFTDNLYLEISKKADILAEKISEAFKQKGCRLLVEGHTNQVFPVLSKEQAEKLRRNFNFTLWQKTEDGEIARFCTSWATTEENVAALCEAILTKTPLH